MTNRHFDVIGLGIGLFNLSVAALLKKRPELNCIFFDRKPGFDWHSEIIFSDSDMQTSYLKDLVTPVDPTNQFSFMNYLVQHGLFYSFINTNRKTITRREFEIYCQWVTKGLAANLQFNSEIQNVNFDGDKFVITVNGETYTADNICVATGMVPRLPQFASDYAGPNVFHAKSKQLKSMDAEGKDVVIVGGGQTGIEIFRNLLQNKWGQAKSIRLVTSRENLEPLDNSPFVNEYFSPSYVKEFLPLEQNLKDPIVKYQKLASDGNTPEYLEVLYRDLYQAKHVCRDERAIEILPSRRAMNMKPIESSYELTIQNRFNQSQETLKADTVILSTGFQTQVPKIIEPLMPLINFDNEGRFIMNSDFQIDWKGPKKNKIFALNFSRHGHGIAEPQTSLMAWRSAHIINTLTQFKVFPVENAVPNFITYN